MKNSKGFTLLEILLVLALVGGMAALMLPRLSTVDRVKSTVRRLHVVVKQVQNQARLSNTLHRLVFELTPEKDSIKDKFEQSFYIEAAQTRSAAIVMGDDNAAKKKDEEDLTPEPYKMDTKILKKKQTLPPNFFFEGVEYKDKSIENGKAYIYFFPQGYVTQAAIHITNREKINYTIVTHPLTGETTIFNENKNLKGLQQ